MADPLSTYTFLPWVRQGVSSQIDLLDDSLTGGPERAQVEVGFEVNDEPVSNQVQLLGPGDVIGINPQAIVRNEPRHGTTDFEANYLPFVEFLEPSFLWRYTPAAATPDHRLRPWVSLIVLTLEEFDRARPGPLPSISLLNPAALAKNDEVWAWAHVHASRDLTDGGDHTVAEAVDALEDLIERNRDQAVCRVLCPRKLKPLTAYHAFLIPTFETGRLAGLGEPTTGIDGLLPAWGNGQIDFPVYHEWSFGTGERGDFEFLVNLLEPRQVDERVGIRDIDVSDPDPLVPGLPDPVGLEGALRKPGAVPRPVAWPPDPPQRFVTELETVVNRQQDLLDDPDPSGVHPDPIVSPPLYGRWHAMASRVDATQPGWPNELNTDPRHRMPAAFGTEVVQKDQERLMQRAWQQLGDLLEANQRIRRMQLAILANRRLYKRHIRTLEHDQVLTITQPVHARVLGSPETVHELLGRSIVPQAATASAFRKITRPRGVVADKVLPATTRRPADLITRLNDDKNGITAAPPKQAPVGQISLDAVVEELVPLPRGLLRYSRWILLALVVPAVVLTVAFGAVAAIAVAGVAITFGAVTEWARRRATQADSLTEAALTEAAVAEIPPRPAFAITDPGTRVGAAAAGERDSAEGSMFRAAAVDLHRRFEAPVPQPVQRTTLALASAAQSITATLDPATAIPRRARAVVQIPDSYQPLRPVDTIAPVLAHPIFADPMYAPLRDISADNLIPNLHLIPDDTVALMETNQRFIEAYMVGLNHEMARELLWRGFWSDQRGSYFRQFWDVGDVVNRDPSRTASQIEEALRDIKPLHRWAAASALGSHENRPLPSGTGDDARLVLVVKGRLLQRYPTTVIFAQRAVWEKDEFGNDVRRLDETDPANNIQEAVFKAEIEPDLTFLGFDLTAGEVKGRPTRPPDDPGWFIVFHERPGQPRFGMDVLERGDTLAVSIETWNQLVWEHLGISDLQPVDLTTDPPAPTDEPDRSVIWGSNSADLAYILYQAPAMVAFHAGDMLS